MRFLEEFCPGISSLQTYSWKYFMYDRLYILQVYTFMGFDMYCHEIATTIKLMNMLVL